MQPEEKTAPATQRVQEVKAVSPAGHVGAKTHFADGHFTTDVTGSIAGQDVSGQVNHVVDESGAHAQLAGYPAVDVRTPEFAQDTVREVSESVKPISRDISDKVWQGGRQQVGNSYIEWAETDEPVED